MNKQEILNYLEIHGKDIGKMGREGNKVCINIMKYYEMFRKCQDGMTQVFLEEEIKRYKQLVASL